MSRHQIIELPEELKNLISAGEVVERPASVVKELVENSIDAEATIIRIELLDGGLKKIIVTDNGIGMNKDEIPLALKRNATSKIRTSDDLFSISSLGFRGEALPSIASVSLFKISSSTNDLDGYSFYCKNGKIISEKPCAMPKGTKIEVEDLFYNTPARYKHLGSASQEVSNITSYVNKIVLAYPEISFILSNNNKTLIQTDGGANIQLIISETFGNDVARNLINFDGTNDLYHIHGFTTSNAINRSNKNGIIIITNGRVIKNQSLIYAITDAYQTILPIGKYPITVLYINCDYSLVDVNIHPSKLEIKFTDEFRLKQLISKTIYQAINKKELITDQLVQENKFNDYNTYNEPTLPTAFEFKKNEELPTETLWDMFEEYDDQKNEDSSFSFNSINETKKIDYEPDSLIKEKDNEFFKNLNYIGQFNKTYLLLENDDNLYIIDQHAAMERCMYEKIRDSLIHDNSVLTYELLIPLKLEYNVSQLELIMEQNEELKKMHIIIEPFGNNTILVRELPSWIKESNAENFVRDIIEHLLSNRNVNKQIMLDSLAKKLSCKKSIKANMAITDLEVSTLMANLDNCEMPYTCPHGRPTTIKFTKYELEKMFKRVM